MTDTATKPITLDQFVERYIDDRAGDGTYQLCQESVPQLVALAEQMMAFVNSEHGQALTRWFAVDTGDGQPVFDAVEAAAEPFDQAMTLITDAIDSVSAHFCEAPTMNDNYRAEVLARFGFTTERPALRSA